MGTTRHEACPTGLPPSSLGLVRPLSESSVWSLGRLGFVAATADAQGRLTLPVAVPAVSSLVGLSIFTQGLGLVPQLQGSDGLEVLPGAR